MKALLRGITAQDAERVSGDPSRLYLLAKPGGDSIVLEKTWHVIHFLLCGEAWGGPQPLKHAILGGVEVGRDDIHVLGPEAALLVAKSLALILPEDLLARFDALTLDAAEIYPGGWSYSTYDWATAIRADYESLRAFYTRRATQDESVLIQIA